MLYRAGTMLQQALYLYGRQFFDKHIKKVKRNNGEVVFVEGNYTDADAFYPFPRSLFLNEIEEHAALLF